MRGSRRDPPSSFPRSCIVLAAFNSHSHFPPPCFRRHLPLSSITHFSLESSPQPPSPQPRPSEQQRAWDVSLPGIASWVGGLIISASGAQADASYSASPPLSPEQLSWVCPAIDLGSAVDLGFDGALHLVHHYPQEGLVEVGDAVAFLLGEIESMGSRIIYGAEVRLET